MLIFCKGAWWIALYYCYTPNGNNMWEFHRLDLAMTKAKRSMALYAPLNGISNACEFCTDVPWGHLRTLGDLENWKVNATLTSTSTLSRSKIQSVSLYVQPFQSYRPFWDKCTEWPQNDLFNTTRSKVRHTHGLLVPRRPECYSVSLCGKPFPRYLQIFIFPMITVLLNCRLFSQNF